MPARRSTHQNPICGRCATQSTSQNITFRPNGDIYRTCQGCRVRYPTQTRFHHAQTHRTNAVPAAIEHDLQTVLLRVPYALYPAGGV